MPCKNQSSLACITCRVRKKKCGGPGETGACDDCTRLNIECLHGYGLSVPRELRDQQVIRLIKQHTKHPANRTGPQLQLRHYITTPLPSDVASPSTNGFRFDANNVEIDASHSAITPTPNTEQVDSHPSNTHAQRREATTSGPLLTTLPPFQTPVVNPAYGHWQYASHNSVLASASPDPTGISSISARDAARAPTAPQLIAGDNSFHQTQRTLFDYSVGPYAPHAHGVIACNARDDLANCFTSREAQPVYHFSESEPPSFDPSFTHPITAGLQDLWLDSDGNDSQSVTGHQDGAQNLDTLGSGLERSFVRPNFLHVLGQ